MGRRRLGLAILLCGAVITGAEATATTHPLISQAGRPHRVLSALDSQGALTNDVLEVADAAIADRLRLANSEHDARLIDPLRQESRNVSTARTLAGLGDQATLKNAVDAAEVMTEWQADTIGGNVAASSVEPPSALPSAAGAALAARFHVSLTRDQAIALRKVDRLPQVARDAVTRVIDAFMEFLGAARAATATPPTAGVDSVLGTRVSLLDAAVAARAALAVLPLQLETGTQIPGVLSIDLGSTDSVYTQDFALLLDAGGNDTYFNNAGSNREARAAALIDLGGDDRYGEGLFGSGTNGAGYGGSGFLFDAAGNDTYLGGVVSNGASFADLPIDGATGFLLDGSGNDRYEALAIANGEGSGSLGLLVDGGGIDVYRAGNDANGGAQAGAGALVDLGSNPDDYVAESGGVAFNGGGYGPASGGFLYDGGGRDVYFGGGRAANGGGWQEGTGFLFDAGAEPDLYTVTGLATNGGAADVGVGLLVDVGGSDNYVAGGEGTNGGAVRGAAGFLIDGSGADQYNAGDFGTNGGGFSLGLGFLSDAGLDNDNYVAAGRRGTNGGGAGRARNAGTGWLFDAGGRDAYADPSGSRFDCTIVPKGKVGAQVDAPHTRCRRALSVRGG